MTPKRLARPVVCPRCALRGDERPGFAVRDYERLEAVFVDDSALVGDRLPRRLVCLRCGWARPVYPGEVEIVRP